MLPGISPVTPGSAGERAGRGFRPSMICAMPPRRCLSIEGQHRPRYFAGFHCAEGFVDVAETAAFGHHVVEVEAALAVEIEVERDVDPEAVGAHARGLHLAFRADRHPGKLNR